MCCAVRDRAAPGGAAGLDDDARPVVYYTALLVNVGCHADAHEQAKWFGDDIGVKSLKYQHEPRSMATVAASLRLVGQGNPPLHPVQSQAAGRHRRRDQGQRPADDGGRLIRSLPRSGQKPGYA
jgi:hypothetical protein